MNVTLEQAYAEACRALGEQIVERRLLAQAVEDAPPAEESPN